MKDETVMILNQMNYFPKNGFKILHGEDRRNSRACRRDVLLLKYLLSELCDQFMLASPNMFND